MCPCVSVIVVWVYSPSQGSVYGPHRDMFLVAEQGRDLHAKDTVMDADIDIDIYCPCLPPNTSYEQYIPSYNLRPELPYPTLPHHGHTVWHLVYFLCPKSTILPLFPVPTHPFPPHHNDRQHLIQWLLCPLSSMGEYVCTSLAGGSMYACGRRPSLRFRGLDQQDIVQAIAAWNSDAWSDGSLSR